MIALPTAINHNVNFDYTAPEDQAPLKAWSACILHMAPGTTYGSVEPIIMRLMFFTWCRTFLLLEMP